MEVYRQVDRRQKALVYRFLKPHREDFIPQLEPDVKSVNFSSFLVYFLHFWFVFNLS